MYKKFYIFNDTVTNTEKIHKSGSSWWKTSDEVEKIYSTVLQVWGSLLQYQRWFRDSFMFITLPRALQIIYTKRFVHFVKLFTKIRLYVAPLLDTCG